MNIWCWIGLNAWYLNKTLWMGNIYLPIPPLCLVPHVHQCIEENIPSIHSFHSLTFFFTYNYFSSHCTLIINIINKEDKTLMATLDSALLFSSLCLSVCICVCSIHFIHCLHFASSHFFSFFFYCLELL